MRTLSLLFILFLIGSCGSAQNLKIENAWHEVSLGGVRGARTERFTIIAKESETVRPLYLMIGDVKIDLNKSTDNGNVILTGVYFPESQPTVTENGTVETDKNNFDLRTAYLVSDNRNSKLEMRQKITFKTKSNPKSAGQNEDVPE